MKKISGIDYIDADHFACINDEAGTIFIYNTSTQKIEEEIPFAPPGDYEGITLVNDNAYVACADGRLYEILGFRSGKPGVKEYGTHLTVKQNVEGLCYDKKNNRLLVVIKGKEEGTQSYKGIYAFDLSTKTMPIKPVFKIDMQDSVFSKLSGKRPQSVMQPSEIGIHPILGDIYITDGNRPQLLIMDKAGEIKTLYTLNKSAFIQPEGIAFTPSGELFISSEGNKQRPGLLLQVDIEK